ncbi:MAG TPA: AAA family ATPase [Marmoricola sp.]|nr:AAA family ATPase [Marmoricola sp.]
MLLEREPSLEVLDDLARDALDGTGRVAAVVAPAGVGKTSVLEAAIDRFRTAGLQVLFARGSAQETALPHGITRTLLGPVLRDDGVRARVLVEAAAPAAVLFSGSPEGATGSLLHALYWLLANLVASGPLALVVDDAHEVDDATLEFLAYVSRRIVDLPILLVVATRPRSQADWKRGLDGIHEQAVEVPIPTLTPVAVADVAARELGAEVPQEFASACHRVTGGNPFYLVELLGDLARRGVEPATADTKLVEDLAPPAIVRSVLLRLAGISAGAVDVARACAVLGDGCRLDVAAELAGLAVDDAASSADALVAAGLLAGTGPGLGFAHPILRSAVLGDLGRHERARWHDRAARILEHRGASSAVVATHILLTEPAGDPWVASVLLAAAREAASAGAPEAAVDLLRRAQEEPPPPHVQDVHLFELGVAEAARADLAALDHLRASIAATDDAGSRAQRALVFAEFARKAGLVPVGIAALDTAIAALDPSSSAAALASIERYWIGRTMTSTIDLVSVDRPVLDRAFAHEDPVVRRRAAAYLAMESALSGTRGDVGRYLDVALAPPGLERCVEPDAGVIAAALFTLNMTERHAEFERLVGEVLAEAGRTGNGVGHVLACLYRGQELLRFGRLAEMEVDVVEAMEFSTEHGWPKGTAELVALRAVSCLLQGKLAAADQELAESPFSVDVLENTNVMMLLDARGQVALARGDADGALRDVLRAGDALERLGVTNPGFVAWRSHASSALRLKGDVAEARSLAEEELAVAKERSGPAAQAAALRSVAATLDRGEALEALEEAQALVAGGPAVLEQALVAAELGAALRRLGHTTDARGPLATSLDLATRCGAAPLAESVRAELLAAGGRPRRTSVTGPDALTASERRVTRLAASGQTNSVIAQTLFVSRKTVEKHLANAYAKLGITNRAGLADVDLG